MYARRYGPRAPSGDTSSPAPSPHASPHTSPGGSTSPSSPHPHTTAVRRLALLSGAHAVSPPPPGAGWRLLSVHGADDAAVQRLVTLLQLSVVQYVSVQYVAVRRTVRCRGATRYCTYCTYCTYCLNGCTTYYRTHHYTVGWRRYHGAASLTLPRYTPLPCYTPLPGADLDRRAVARAPHRDAISHDLTLCLTRT